MKLAAAVTVLVLHGGGFVGGNPGSVEPIASDLRAAGYNAIAVPYRDDPERQRAQELQLGHELAATAVRLPP
jgi:acetyl esterase/lipase